MYVVFGENWWQRLFMRGLYKIVAVEYENYHVVFFKHFRLYKWVSIAVVYHRESNPSEEER